jgi:hypothetical protein
MYIIAAAHCCQITKRQNINLQQKLKNFKKPKKKKEDEIQPVLQCSRG